MKRPTDQLQEQVLVLRCQAGDDRAFAELVERHHERLRYYAERLCGTAAVDDILQDTWLDAYIHLPRLRAPAAFRAWLYRIARNKAFSDLRRRRRLPHSLPDGEWPAAPQDEPQFSAEDAAQIRSCLERLSVEHKEVLALRFVEEMDYEEIAGVVGCPVGTVRSRLYYAKMALRREMERMSHEL